MDALRSCGGSNPAGNCCMLAACTSFGGKVGVRQLLRGDSFRGTIWGPGAFGACARWGNSLFRRALPFSSRLGIPSTSGGYGTAGALLLRGPHRYGLVRTAQFCPRKTEAARLDATRREEEYHTVADYTHDWEYWIGPDGKFRYVSRSCHRISGYAAEEFLADPGLLERIAHPDDKDALIDHVRGELRPEEPLSLEFRIITRDGATRWIEHVCQPIHDARGQFVGRRASNRDATERKQSEETFLNWPRSWRAAATSSVSFRSIIGSST